MPIELGEIYARIKVDASQVAAGLASARAQIAKFGAEMGSTFDGATAAVKRQNGSIQQWKASQDAAAATVKKTNAAVVEQSNSVKKLGDTYFESMRKVSAMKAAASEMAIAGTAITAAYVGTIKTGAEFNLHLQQIQANTGLTTQQMKDLRASTESLGTSLGGNMSKIADGTMHAMNLLHDFNAARAVTIAGAKAAIATGGDESQVINGLAKAMKEWNIPMSRADQTMNGLLVSAQRANSTLPEMMEHTNRLRAVFAGLNVPLYQMVALFQTLTQRGFSPAQAETQALNIVNSILKPTKAAKDFLGVLEKVDPQLKQMFSLQGLQHFQLSDILQHVTEDTKKLGFEGQEGLQKLFNGLRALPGVLALSNGNFKDLIQNTNESKKGFEGHAQVDKAVENSQKELGRQIERLQNQFVIMAAVVAKDMTPGLLDLMRAIKGLFDNLRSLDPVTRHFIEWGGLAAGAALLLGSRILGLAATFYQLRTAILAAQTAGTGGVVGKFLAAGGVGVTGVAAAAVAATGYVVGLGIPAMSDEDRRRQMQSAMNAGQTAAGLAKRIADNNAAIRFANAGTNVAALRAENVRLARQLTDMTASNTPPPKTNPGLTPANPFATGNETLDEMMKRHLKEQKERDKAARAAAAEAKRDAKETARDLERDAEETKEATRDAIEKLYDLTHNEYDRERRDVMKEVNQMTANRVPRELRQQYLNERFGKIAAQEAADKEAGSVGRALKDSIDAIQAGLPTLFKEADEAVKNGLREDAAHKAELVKQQADLFKTFGQNYAAALQSSIDAAVTGANKGVLRGRSEGGDSPDKVQADIQRLQAARVSASKQAFRSILDDMSKVYAFDYEQQNVAGENYLRFLRYKQLLTEKYSEEWMQIQREMKKVEDDLNKSSTEETKKTVSEKARIWREMLKDLQRNFTNILANLFDDLLSGHKNPFQAFFDAFKQMLIRMAAELAASELIKLITGLFKGGKKGAGAGGVGGGAGGGTSYSDVAAGIAAAIPGGAPFALGIGALGKIFHFAEGGWVPGPIGAPQPAVVHGGEFVVSRQMMAEGAGGGNVSFPGATFHFHGIKDIASFDRAFGDWLDKRSRTRQGSG